MLYWILVFLVVAMVAALFGFTGIYVAAAGIAKILFFIFLVLFVVSLLAGGMNRRAFRNGQEAARRFAARRPRPEDFRQRFSGLFCANRVNSSLTQDAP